MSNYDIKTVIVRLSQKKLNIFTFKIKGRLSWVVKLSENIIMNRIKTYTYGGLFSCGCLLIWCLVSHSGSLLDF